MFLVCLNSIHQLNHAGTLALGSTCHDEMYSSIPGSLPRHVLIWTAWRLLKDGGRGFLLSFRPALIRMYIMMCKQIIMDARKMYSTHMSAQTRDPSLQEIGKLFKNFSRSQLYSQHV